MTSAEKFLGGIWANCRRPSICVVGLLLSWLCGALCPAAADTAERLNVIVFFVDDMGWTDLSCCGSDLYETPHIDQLAAQGVRFTQAYAACTVCSPSRAALLTGQAPARLHVTDFIPGHNVSNTPLTIPNWTQRLPLKSTTLAELLQQAGYRTAHVGKWHLTPRDRTLNPNDDGNYPEFYPEQHGFEFNIGGCERGAPSSYFWPYGRGKTLQERRQNNTFRMLPPGGGGEGTYLTDQLADEAVRLVNSFGQEPFFLYFPFYNVHTPLQAPPQLVEKYRRRLQQQPDRRHTNPVYAAMVETVDTAVGRVLDQVTQQGVAQRTLVIFTSDNGGLAPKATSNFPVRQGKGSIYEGGVRVPGLIRWPGVAEPGGVCDEPVITMDVFPTVLEAVGVPIPPELKDRLDGVSLKPLLQQPQSARLPRKALYWHYPHYHLMGAVPHSAIRSGRWKLIEHHRDQTVELYDLETDLHEDHNLVLQQPDRVRKLQQQLSAWRENTGAQMPAVNSDYDPNQPTGRQRGDRWSPMSPVRRD